MYKPLQLQAASRLTYFLSERTVLVMTLALAGILGLAFVFLVPPWQHYDEPDHFEYAWLIANRSDLPEPGDYDAAMRRETARSMIQHGFFDNLGFLPNLNAQDEPVFIGYYSQLGDPPLYYLLASLPLRLIPASERTNDIAGQLYLVRMVSLVLYLLATLCIYGAIREITSKNNPLRWLVPLFVALLPGFVDSMTAANSDAGAILFFSVFIWGALRIIQRGFSLKRLVWVTASAAACFFTKSSVWAALPLAVLALLLSILHPGWRRAVWILLVIGIFAGVAAALSWGDAALWLRASAQDRSTRIEDSLAPLGRAVFRLDAGNNAPAQILQLAPDEIKPGLQGKTVTVGAWMWASQPVRARTPAIHANSSDPDQYQEVELGQTPAFFAFTAQLPLDTKRLMIRVEPSVQQNIPGLEVYYDGLVMVEGDRPTREIPQFASTAGEAGTWGGAPFTNLIRGGSAERGWPFIRPWADRLGQELIPDQQSPSLVLYTLLDWRGAGSYYRMTILQLADTFWGKFGWGNVPLLWAHLYWLLRVVLLLGLISLPFALWVKRAAVNWHAALWLLAAGMIVWSFALLRGSIYVIYQPFIPGARYAFPAIFPTIAALAAGWLAVTPFKMRRAVLFAIPIGLAILDIFSMISISSFYSG